MPTGPAVGLLPDAAYFVQQAVLEPGSLLFMYTDGVTEARNPQGEMFGEEDHVRVLLPRHLQDLLGRHHDPEGHDLVVVAAEHDANDVLANVMHIAFYCS